MISPALEDYLETILGLVHAKGAARARDIADALAVHKSTVTAALRSLAAKGLITYSPYENAMLTPTGRRIAAKVARRHGGIRRFLTDVLLLDERTADENACRMEHVMDQQVTDRLDLFVQYIGLPALSATSAPRGFAEYLREAARAPTRLGEATVQRRAKGAVP